MNVKYVKSGNDCRVYIVESYRTSGDPNPKSRILAKLGLLSDIKKEHIDSDAYISSVLNELEKERSLLKESENREIKSALVDIDPCTDSYASAYHIGHMLVKKIWDELNLSYFFRYYGSKMFGAGADTDRAAFAFCAKAFSELGAQKDAWNSQKCFIENDISEFGNVIGILDVFDELKEKLFVFIRKRLENREKTQGDLLHVFPMIFECERLSDDALKYSDLPVLCFVGTGNGNTVTAGDVFVGESVVSDAHLEKLAAQGDVIVSSRFVSSYNDLVSLREKGLGYIVRSRIRNLPRSVQNDILASEGYVSLGNDYRYKSRTKTEEITYGTRDVLLEEKHIYTFSQKRYLKEKNDRLSLASRSMTFATDTDTSLGQTQSEEVESDRSFDGYRYLRASGCKLSSSEIIDASRLCARIEDNVRNIRGVVENRQTVTWNTKRIRGFFAFSLFVMRLFALVEAKVNSLSERRVSQDRIVYAINSAKVVPVDKAGRIWKSININEDFRLISQALSIPELPDVCTSQTLKRISGFSIRL